MTSAAVIVAAGRGTRAGVGMPKQWHALAGKRVADHAVAAFQDHPRIDKIVLVVHPDDMAQAQSFATAGHSVVIGGADRSTSVRRGLEALQGLEIDTVLIHDVARPCVDAAIISDVLDALDTNDSAAPALPVTDALWTGAGDHVTGTQDRKGLFRAQTPQGFRYGAILAAHQSHPSGAADDVEIARAAGMTVAIVPGSERNLKITTAQDFARAEHLLRTDMDIRLGNGFDVHAFGPGNHVTLCGVNIPHSQGLAGHSDADVSMHAVTDAIYGALAMGDIGQHFPPSDPQWKGAASHIFLCHAVELACAHGFAISNVDCTLICETPKIGPHANDMRTAMAEIIGIEEGRVSVKATTSERLGFAGRGEGIACIATATLVKS